MAMLREIKGVKQERGSGRRRWFESDELDLVVWLDRAGAVIGFQLCYDAGTGEHALTWREESGFAHSRVDLGEGGAARYKGSPVLEVAGPVPWKKIGRLFDACSVSLDATLRSFVRERLAKAGAF